MNSATAFAPANISCIFKIQKGKTLQTTGSTGVGFTINRGVDLEVSKSNKTEVFFNDKKISLPTIISVLKHLNAENIKVKIISILPLGCGFGLSGASALATSYAINDLLSLNKTKLELAKVAHIAEVENGTGLGDVTNQYFGGFILKTEPSFNFIVRKLPISNVPVFCKVFSKLSTKAIISGTNVTKINDAGEKAKKKIQDLKNPSFAEVIKISKNFAEESSLLQNREVINCIKNIESKGGHASMIMLGNGVFADIPFEGSAKYLIQ